MLKCIIIARVAQLVEHDLAKVGVAGSNPVSRSIYFYVEEQTSARVAQLVEHDLAKVGVAGSNPVSRSTPCPGGGIGRHAGLKILWPLGRAGSSPARGTKQKFIFLLFFCPLLS